jgi:hypothetical protein
MTPNLGILDSRRGSFMVIKRKTKVGVEAGDGARTKPAWRPLGRGDTPATRMHAPHRGGH